LKNRKARAGECFDGRSTSCLLRGPREEKELEKKSEPNWVGKVEDREMKRIFLDMIEGGKKQKRGGTRRFGSKSFHRIWGRRKKQRRGNRALYK